MRRQRQWECEDKDGSGAEAAQSTQYGHPCLVDLLDGDPVDHARKTERRSQRVRGSSGPRVGTPAQTTPLTVLTRLLAAVVTPELVSMKECDLGLIPSVLLRDALEAGIMQCHQSCELD